MHINKYTCYNKYKYAFTVRTNVLSITTVQQLTFKLYKIPNSPFQNIYISGDASSKKWEPFENSAWTECSRHVLKRAFIIARLYLQRTMDVGSADSTFRWILNRTSASITSFCSGSESLPGQHCPRLGCASMLGCSQNENPRHETRLWLSLAHTSVCNAHRAFCCF